MESLQELLNEQLKDIYNAEHQLLKALPRMAKKASSATLRQALTNHLKETETQIKRLDAVGKELGTKLTGKRCAAMMGLMEEGKEVLEEEGRNALIDVALGGAGLRVEHYETAAYSAAKAIAEKLGETKVVGLLQQNLDEEIAASEKLEEIAASESLPEAMEAGTESQEEMISVRT